jgi:hypothetical protein
MSRAVTNSLVCSRGSLYHTAVQRTSPRLTHPTGLFQQPRLFVGCVTRPDYDWHRMQKQPAAEHTRTNVPSRYQPPEPIEPKEHWRYLRGPQLWEVAFFTG